MDRSALLRHCLDGLSLGDAFGERFFGPRGPVALRIHARAVPPGPWPYTDDTELALGIAEVLERFGFVDQDALAQVFGRRFVAHRDRGYGAKAFEILGALAEGRPWPLVARSVFGGQGSMGNGGAMRAAPVGAFFAGDRVAVIEQARRSSEVTHAHPEGQAGAVAVALAASWAVEHPDERDGAALLAYVHQHTPDGETRDGLAAALEQPFGRSPEQVAEVLGSGQRVLSSDTVPFSLWCAARHLGAFEEAMWATVSGLGDRDTTCAIAGGVVALTVAPTGLPLGWLARREPLQHASV